MDLGGFMEEWWPGIAGAILVVAKVLNMISIHWTSQSGFIKKAAGFLIEFTDLIRIPEIKRGVPVVGAKTLADVALTEDAILATKKAKQLEKQLEKQIEESKGTTYSEGGVE